MLYYLVIIYEECDCYPKIYYVNSRFKVAQGIEAASHLHPNINGC